VKINSKFRGHSPISHIDKSTAEKKVKFPETKPPKNSQPAVVDEIRREIRNGEIKTFHDVAKNLSSFFIKEGIGKSLGERDLKKIVEVVTKTIEEDPLLSQFIRKTFPEIK